MVASMRSLRARSPLAIPPSPARARAGAHAKAGNAAVVEAVGGGSIRGDSPDGIPPEIPRGIPGKIRGAIHGAIHGEVYRAIDRIRATIKECADGDAGDFIGITAIPCHGAKCTLPQ